MPADHDVRVLLCIPQLAGGGAERQIRQLLPRLAERGLGISLFGRLSPDDVASLKADGIACYPISAAGNHDPRLVGELARAASRVRAQIIHTCLTQMDVIGGTVALATGRTWLLSERSSPAEYGRRLKDRARARLGRYADAIVANSGAGLDAWPNHPRRIVIANGLDFDAIREAPALALCEKTAGRPLIVTAARLVPSKQVEAVIRAVAQLRLKFPDVRLAILGDGPEAARLKTLSVGLGLEDSILLAGYRTDVWTWIKSASVFVSASRIEGHPNAVLEAAAAGTPQVLSDIAEHRDAVGDSGALFVAPGDVNALADAIAALIERPARARDLAESAQSAVRALSIDRAADLYAALYRRAASGQAFPGAGRGEGRSRVA